MSSKKRRTYNTDNTSDISTKQGSTSAQEKQRKVSSDGVTTVYAPINKIEGAGEVTSKNPLFLILCFFVPFIIMGICFAASGVYPFGDMSVLYSDCKAQYFPFLQELQSKLQNGGSLFYSWNTGMGSNFIAMIGYYIASPLNLLTAFVPSEFLLTAMALLIMTKVSAASLFTGIYIKTVFRRNDFSLVAFGSCFAFCNFMMGYYWDVIWLDAVALLPLIALGVYKLVYRKEYKLFIISLAVAMIANYYIGYMLCLFTFFWFFILWAIYPKSPDKKKLFFRSLCSIAGYSAIALALSCVIVVPSLIQLQNTVATNDVFPSFAEFFKAYNSMFDVLGNTLGFHDPVTMQGLPNTYCSILCILLAVVFMRSQKISVIEKVFSLGFIVFLLLSLNLKGLDYIWHGLHYPNQIPYRFAFIFCFFLIITAYRAFSMSDFLQRSDIVALGITAAVMMFIGFISTMNTDQYNTMETKSVLLSTLFAVVYIFVILLKTYKFLPSRMFTVIISLILILEMGLNCYTGVKTVGVSSTDYPNKLTQVRQLLNYIEDSDTDDDFYRVDMTDISSKNDGVYYGYKGISQFSSTSDKNVLNFMSHIGITAKRSSWHYLQTSPLVTSFFNIKHLISRDGYIAADTSLEFSTDVDGACLYDYDYYLPIGFMTDSTLAGMDINAYGYAFDAQNDFFKMATGLDKNIYNELTATSAVISEGTITPNERVGEYYYESTTGANATFTYTVPTDGMVYAYANFRDCSQRIEVSGPSVSRSVDIDARRYVFPAGNYKAGDTITFTSTLNLKDSGTVRLYVATFDKALYEQGYELLNDETFDTARHNDTHIEGTITAKNDGLMWTSIPYEKGGWKVYVDGKEAETIAVCGAFVGVMLESGEHNVSFEYSVPGFNLGLAISCVALLAFAALCVIDFLKKKKQLDALQESTK